MVNVLAELLMAVSALQAGLVATAPSLVMIPRGEAIVRMSANVNTMESAIRSVKLQFLMSCNCLLRIRAITEGLGPGISPGDYKHELP